ncbi:MAG: PrgI family protein [Candidatus Adlerbacteria bacterium]|nr:PrgI family protein [Candidatus Adlerbacteria bacterium]MDZ4225958.1 PrgI family protein [Patescibacteria group bacterium]
MAQYQVPQFIEIEDKIFGPLTLKQFLYLAGGGGLCLIFFTLLPLWLAIPLMLPVIGFVAALAFYQVNGRPFIMAVEHAFSYFFGNKLYLWKQRQTQAVGDKQQTIAKSQTSAMIVPALSESKLKDLAWSLNIKDRNKMGVRDAESTGFEI